MNYLAWAQVLLGLTSIPLSRLELLREQSVTSDGELAYVNALFKQYSITEGRPLDVDRVAELFFTRVLTLSIDAIQRDAIRQAAPADPAYRRP